MFHVDHEAGVSFAKVQSLAIEPRQFSRTGSPIERVWCSHGHYCELLKEQLALFNVRIIREFYYVSGDRNQIMLLGYDIELPNAPELPFNGCYCIASMHSHSAQSSFISKLYLGARVYSTHAGLVSFETNLGVNETYANNWRSILYTGAYKILKKIGSVSLMVNSLKSTPLSDTNAATLIVALSQGVLTSSGLKNATSYYFTNPYNYVELVDRNAFALYNACVMGLVKNKPESQLHRMGLARRAFLPTFDQEVINRWPFP